MLIEVITGIIVSEFREFLRPTERPILSKFCKEVTNIRQHQVDRGITLKECMTKFDDWVEKLTNKYNMKWGSCDLCRNDVNTALVTWNNWDIEYLWSECTRKNIYMPNYFDKWADLVFIWKVLS